MNEQEWLQKLRTAGWSPESLQRALNEDPIPQKDSAETDLASRLDLQSTTNHHSSGRLEDLSHQFSHLQIKSLKDSPACFENKENVPQNVDSNLTHSKLAVGHIPHHSTVKHSIAPDEKKILQSHAAAPFTVKSDAPGGSQFHQLVNAAALDDPLPNGWNLFQHQKEAIIECLKLGRSIMAFDMGLGKTVISLIWAKAVCSVCPGCVAVVIAPCTLMEVWRREAEMVGFVSLENSVSRRTAFADSSSVVCGRERNDLQIKIVSWAKIPSPAEIGHRYVLVADEAHAMQSITSIRTKAALDLCNDRQCLGAVLASGTPMRNGRPANIYPLLAGIRHPIARNKIEFEKRYCNARKTKFCPWDVTGASNLEELRRFIGPHLMRKTKEECLDIPVLQRTTLKIEPAPEDVEAYQGILGGMKAKAKQSYAINQGKGGPAGGRNGNPLEMMAQLRSLASRAKVPGTAKFIRTLRKTCRDPLVVFVWFKETARLLVDALTATTTNSSSSSGGDGGRSHHNSRSNSSSATSKKSNFINLVDDDDDDDDEEVEEVVEVLGDTEETRSDAGEQDDEEDILRCECFTGDILKHEVRQALVDRFQRGELDVLVCTYGVGSTGITLTRSHTVILLDRPWTPGDAAQAEDRVRRIGQKSSTVESYWIEAFELDQKLDALLESKASNTAKVVRSTASLEDTNSAPSSSSKGGAKKAATLSGGKQKANPAGMKTITNFFAPLSGSGSSLGADATSTARPSSAVNKGSAVLALQSSTGSLMAVAADDAKFGDSNQEEVDTDSVMSAILKQLLR